jgi:hypothetical protein
MKTDSQVHHTHTTFEKSCGMHLPRVNAHHDLKSGSLQEAHLLAHAPLTPASSYYGSTSKDGVYTDALTEARPLDEAEVLVRQSFKGGHKSSQKQHVFDK